MLLAMTVLAMIFFPQDEAAYQTIRLGEFKGVYNSAWIGNTLAMLNVSFLPLILFYFLRGSIQRDASSRRGEIYVATQLRKFDYLMGKAVSNLVVALLIVAWMTCTAFFMQLWIGEDVSINIAQLMLPQLIHVLPMLLIVSMITLVFDAVPALRASLGNITYFFLASAGLVLLSYDISGIDYVISQMKAQILETHGVQVESINIGISTVSKDAVSIPFVLNGISYKEYPDTSIGYIIASSLVLFTIAWLSFNMNALLARSSNEGSRSRLAKIFSEVTAFAPRLNRIIHASAAHSVFLNVTRQEFLLLSTSKSPYLWLSLCILWLAQCFVSVSLLLSAVLPAVMLLAALVISSLGQREKAHDTQGFLINGPLLMKVQYPSMLAAGVMFLLLITLPSMLRLGLMYEFYAIALLMTGFLCTVSAAILLGTLSGSNKAFEIAFVIVWYMGPISHFTYLDFIGVDLLLSKQNNIVGVFICVAVVINAMIMAVRTKSLR